MNRMGTEFCYVHDEQLDSFTNINKYNCEFQNTEFIILHTTKIKKSSVSNFRIVFKSVQLESNFVKTMQ